MPDISSSNFEQNPEKLNIFILKVTEWTEQNKSINSNKKNPKKITNSVTTDSVQNTVQTPTRRNTTTTKTLKRAQRAAATKQGQRLTTRTSKCTTKVKQIPNSATSANCVSASNKIQLAALTKSLSLLNKSDKPAHKYEP
ncbi:unnamed protein product [Clavelina lepadiformis]|uniref:Uncharacterized protein n=1 Tax=Clavelina lepadiformis TaxID=159417 RepID=A0ABP0FSI1_CLALP